MITHIHSMVHLYELIPSFFLILLFFGGGGGGV